MSYTEEFERRKREREAAEIRAKIKFYLNEIVRAEQTEEWKTQEIWTKIIQPRITEQLEAFSQHTVWTLPDDELIRTRNSLLHLMDLKQSINTAGDRIDNYKSEAERLTTVLEKAEKSGRIERGQTDG